MVRQLSDDWRETVRPVQGLLDQANRMDIGYEMAQNGQMLAGSQAILISFNKMLDPTSVVRESEYARSATGQSALETMRGFVDKLKEGGAGSVLSVSGFRALLPSLVPPNTPMAQVSQPQGGGPQGDPVAPVAEALAQALMPQGPAAPGPGVSDVVPITQAEPPGAYDNFDAGAAQYDRMAPDVLQAKVSEMAASPDNFSLEELMAAKRAFDRAFGGQR